MVGLVGLVAAAGCGTGSSTSSEPASDAPVVDGGAGGTPGKCPGTTPSPSTPGVEPAVATGLVVPQGFVIERIAQVPAARELAALPNGDLLVATNGATVYVVPNAENAGGAGSPVVFATVNDAPTQGVAFDAVTCTVFFGAQHGVYSASYEDGAVSVNPSKIASVRTGPVAPNSDGDVHSTTSVAVAKGVLYASVGSSCNACTEADGTRAVILQMGLDGSNVQTKATRIRNAIALTTNTDTGTLWAGNAGQDDLPKGHPYEFFDAVTLHPGVADYGWPECEENQVPYVPGADCAETVVPRVEFPAYSTLIGAAHYSPSHAGAHAFPSAQRGFFVAAHGSWHKANGVYSAPPFVALVPMNGDDPVTPVDWTNPSTQWSQFVGGFQSADGTSRSARPTGLAVGPAGSLFIADDQNGLVYRVRPQ
ncbi:L-sorbosone dehydrogenase [Labilithrix luteola]|uniref:L-sorbosone dehydrogenase n=1 Tax=Labilithrix luteola TaxID=1391654 RepID=A0A0K1QAV6_9BACT|nr:L-sorbosone dehydrogenase [Labilithrix luteola]